MEVWLLVHLHTTLKEQLTCCSVYWDRRASWSRAARFDARLRHLFTRPVLRLQPLETGTHGSG
jgi:hypothetical protein